MLARLATSWSCSSPIRFASRTASARAVAAAMGSPARVRQPATVLICAPPQRPAGVETEVDRAKQRGQRIDRPGAFGSHLLPRHHQDPQRFPNPLGSGPTKQRDLHPLNRSRDSRRIQWVRLTVAPRLRLRHRRRLDQGKPAPRDQGQAGAVTADALNDEQHRIRVCDVSNCPVDRPVQPGRRGRKRLLVQFGAGHCVMTAKVWVAAWVSTPTSFEYCSDTMDTAAPLDRTDVAQRRRSGLGTAGHACKEPRRARSGRLSIKPPRTTGSASPPRPGGQILSKSTRRAKRFKSHTQTKRRHQPCQPAPDQPPQHLQALQLGRRPVRVRSSADHDG